MTPRVASETERRGRPPVYPEQLVEHVVRLKLSGLSLAAISDHLNTEGLVTALSQTRWQKSYVDRLLHTRHR